MDISSQGGNGPSPLLGEVCRHKAAASNGPARSQLVLSKEKQTDKKKKQQNQQMKGIPNVFQILQGILSIKCSAFAAPLGSPFEKTN